jgi:tetratricopeptide (TPR) repeat protein
MRILGPDGQPIQSGPPVAPEVRQAVEQAKAIAEQGEPHNALQQMVFAFQQDVRSDLVIDTTIQLLEQIVKLAGATNSQELEIFRNIQNHRDDPAAYQQAGHWFAQSQQFFVSLPFFRRAKELLGDSQNELSQAVEMGLAQVLMSLGAYEQAVNTFHELNDRYGSLPPWLLMELAECYALLRQSDAADAVYRIAPPEAFEQFAEFPALPMIRDEVGDLLARVRDFDEVDDMVLSDWHYVQTRGILIEMNPNPDPGQEQLEEAQSADGAEDGDEDSSGEPKSSGRFVYFAPSEEDVAYIVGVSAAFLDAKGYAPSKLLWLGADSEPLARLFGEWWEVEQENIREYRHGDNTDDESELALLVMSHSYDINLSLPVNASETDSPETLNQMAEEQFFDLMQARAGMIVYALDLRWTERQPMAPDVAGFMTQQCSLPWETRYEVNEADGSVSEIVETRTPQQVAEDIAKRFPPSEKCDEVAAELMEDYSICTDLILDHRDGTLVRRPMVTHSPVKSPRLGF